MSYVDGFVAAVPTANKAKYIKHAEDASHIFKEHGAFKVVECWGDDVPDGQADLLPHGREAQGRRDRRLRLDHLALARRPQRRHEEGDARSADAGWHQPHALRWQATDLRRHSTCCLRGSTRIVRGQTHGSDPISTSRCRAPRSAGPTPGPSQIPPDPAFIPFSGTPSEASLESRGRMTNAAPANQSRLGA